MKEFFNKTFFKKNKNFPKIIALLMSLVMVLSVIVIHNADNKVEASEAIDFLPAYEASAEDAKIYNDDPTADTSIVRSKTVYVGTTDLSFKLPASNMDMDDPEIALFQDFDYRWTTAVTSADTTGDKLETRASSIGVGETACLYVGTLGSDDTLDATDVFVKVYEYKVVCVNASGTVDFSIDNTNKTATFNPVKKGTTEIFSSTYTEAENEMVYGSVKYLVSSEQSAITKSTWNTDVDASAWKDSASDAIDAAGITADLTDVSKDTTYYAYVAYFDEDGTCLAVAMQDAARDFNPVKIVNPKMKVVNTSDTSTNYIDNTDASDDWSVSGTSVKRKYTYEFTVDQDTKVDIGGTVTDLAKDVTKSIDVTIPTDAATGTSSTVEFKLGNDVEGWQTFKATVNFVNEDSTFTNVKLSANGVTEDIADGDTFYTNGNQVIGSATINSDAKIQSVTLNGANPGAELGTYNETEKTTPLNKFIINASEETKVFSLVATNENGVASTTPFTFTVCCDKTGPSMGDIEFSEYLPGTTTATALKAHSITWKDVTDSNSGLDLSTAVVYQEYGSTKNALTPTDDGAGNFTLDISPDANLKGKNVSYVLVISDKAGNPASKELKVKYVNDNIEVKDIQVSPATKLDKNGQKVINANSFTVTYTVVSDQKLDADKTLLNGTPIGTDLAEPTVEDGLYKYTIEYTYSKSDTDGESKTVTLKAVNVHGATETAENTIVNIDLTKPTASTTQDDTIWYGHGELVVAFTLKDDDAGTYSSGVKQAYVKFADGTRYPEAETDFVTADFGLKIPESADKNGTTFTIYTEDYAGNPNEQSFTYLADYQAPECELDGIEDGKTYSKADAEAGISVTYKLTDNIGIRVGSFDITYDYSHDSTFNYSGKDYEEVIGTYNTPFTDTVKLDEVADDGVLRDGKYDVTIEGNDYTTDAATTVSKTIYVDQTAPVVTQIDINGVSYTDFTSEEFIAATKKACNSILLQIHVKDVPASCTDYSVGLEDAGMVITAGNAEPVTITGTDEKIISINVAASENSAGTNIIGKFSDAVGNSTDFNLNLIVDEGAPVGKIYINNKLATGAETGVVLTDNPVVKVQIAENINLQAYKLYMGYKSKSGDVAETLIIDEAGIGPVSIYEKTYSLSELYALLAAAKGLAGTTPIDAEYTFRIEASDGVNSAVDTNGAADGLKTSFTLDNTAPVIEGITLKVNGSSVGDVLANINDYLVDGANGYNKTLSINMVKANDNAGTGAETLGVKKITITQNNGSDPASTVEVTNGESKEVKILDSISDAGTKVVITISDGHKANSYTYNFFVDADKPTTKLVVDGKDAAAVNNKYLGGGSKDPMITYTVSDDVELKAYKFTITNSDGLTKTVEASETAPEHGINRKSLSLDRVVSKYFSDVYTGDIRSLDNVYTLEIRCEDLAGNTSVTTTKFTLDNTIANTALKMESANPPKFSKYNNVSYDGSTYGQYYNGSVSLSYLAQDLNLNKYEITDNGSTILSGTTSSQGNVPTITAEGDHVVKLTASDAAGNSGVARELRFTIDTISPVISLSLNGGTVSGEHYMNHDGIVNVSVSDTNKDEDDLTVTEIVTLPSQSPVTTVSKTAEGSKNYSTEADYEIKYVAVDRAGNVSEERTVAFRVDKTAPELTFSGIEDHGSSNKSVTVTYALKEAFYWDIVSAKVNVYKGLDGQSEQLIKTVDFKASNATSALSETFTEDGDYRFEFTAEDRAGNTAEKSYSFILDQTAPLIELTGVKNYDKTTNDVELGITLTENFYSSNTVVVKATKTDEAGKVNDIDLGSFPINNAKVSSIAKSFTEDGIYDITVTSKDRAGNESTETVHFTIDKSKPVIKDLSELDNAILNSFTWNFDAEDICSDLTVCDVTVYLDGVEYDGMTDIADGSHTVRVVAKDELGNSSEASYTFLLDTKAPNLIITGIEDGDRVVDAPTIGISVQLDEDTLETVRVNGVTIPVAMNQVTFTPDTYGDYEIVITAYDNAGNTVEKTITFEYARKFNPIWIILLIILLLALIIFIIIILRKRNKDEK